MTDSLSRLKAIRKSLKQEIKVYQLVLKDRRTPVVAKILLGLAIGYFFLPFNIIPDFIPVLGHLDEVIIIPTLIYIAIKLIPIEVVAEHRQSVAGSTLP